MPHHLLRTIMGRYTNGRKQTAPRKSWKNVILAQGLADVPDGTLLDVTPAPGHTYTRHTWPPRGRGRGESLTSDRRINAKLRAAQVIRMRIEGHTWQHIADTLGFADASGAYRAWKRTNDRVEWDRQRELELTADKFNMSSQDFLDACRTIRAMDEAGLP